ncbi:LacI family DNA-binding transcriptional regulator [Oceanomicrobium pacificus]|uniref:Substrate-binding domain-containing protein n=1 Tax=Oceanomicrobium pacificus TaxID=2692916 RepID=A0A6B0TRC7_9RHOB|nr:LacI family DNA-binding transcriptional regulator [Oceanomicrobium pacificus]MXU64355.1 substrate-binding domain-containing protein [Oceanomicrobium pacificus]
MQKKRVSIKQVAEHAGVSAATVSLVLNDKGSISEETRRQVRRSAKALGFILNKNAARLRSGRSLLIGLIVNDISNPFFAELSANVELEAAGAGYLSVMANTQDDLARQQSVIETMIGQGVAGLIISAATGSDGSAFDVIREHGIPFVLCVRDLPGYGADFVGFDNFEAGVLAGRRILGAGRRNIAFIGGAADNTNRIGRFEGVKYAMRQADPDLTLLADLAGPATRQFGDEAATDLLNRMPDVEGIVCFNDYVAIGAYAAIHAAGRKVGSDVAVIGFDNVPESAAWNPPLTTVELFPRAIGGRAAKTLLDKIAHENAAPERVRLTPQLFPRKSA